MSVELLMDLLYDIKLNRHQRISSKYLQNFKKRRNKGLTSKKKGGKKYRVYKIIQSGGSYPDDENFSLDSETLAERMAGIKTALLKIKNSPPPIQISIFSDTFFLPC